MAAMDSWSSCGPQANAHPPPPIAQAPIPRGVIPRSLLPSFLFCMRNRTHNCSWRRLDMAALELRACCGGAGLFPNGPPFDHSADYVAEGLQVGRLLSELA